MTVLELLVDFHKSQERQGPGSKEDTLRALSFTNLHASTDLKIADIGCGTGGQTLTLAEHLDGHFYAVDLFPAFLQPLQDNVEKLGIADRISCIEASMDALPFKKNELDLIWSEGAIYSMGFEKGIQYWKDFLKNGGFLAVSEITWLTQTRPKPLQDFWQAAYPEIATASTKINQLEQNGYNLAGYFILSPDSWIKNYFEPLEAQMENFLERNRHSEAAQKVVREQVEEIELYKTYQEYFSYGFYVARKEG